MLSGSHSQLVLRSQRSEPSGFETRMLPFWDLDCKDSDSYFSPHLTLLCHLITEERNRRVPNRTCCTVSLSISKNIHFFRTGAVR